MSQHTTAVVKKKFLYVVGTSRKSWVRREEVVVEFDEIGVHDKIGVRISRAPLTKQG